MSTRTEAAEHIDVTTAYITYLLKRGVIKRNEEGGYDLDHVRTQYIRSLRRGQGGGKSIPSAEERDGSGEVQEGGQDSSEAAIKRRLLEVKLGREVEELRKIRRANDVADGLKVPLEDYIRTITDIISAIKPHLEAIPSKILRNCPDAPDHLRHAVEKQVIAAVKAGVQRAQTALDKASRDEGVQGSQLPEDDRQGGSNGP
jgi:hypothetical protein